MEPDHGAGSWSRGPALSARTRPRARRGLTLRAAVASDGWPAGGRLPEVPDRAPRRPPLGKSPDGGGAPSGLRCRRTGRRPVTEGIARDVGSPGDSGMAGSEFTNVAATVAPADAGQG